MYMNDNLCIHITELFPQLRFQVQIYAWAIGHILKTLWNIFKILTYIEKVILMSFVSEWQTSDSYILSYFPLMVFNKFPVSSVF